ncbi:outer membrane protein assembly factor BamE [Roseomonas sp. SSH11]|uniref:Outer membrane protein assembly factor BamE n=1 Tax=Pararoseomonas baculiformis TaxID=2820812 RepID=A0ABS4AJ11_9PROT|nr:outer membrane protein assembly factor BamE [Pararoseomonas baculiformis]MBP0446861.1 outer membrane protein assembly factor BamE [Pararoseomonas baculiformis]
MTAPVNPPATRPASRWRAALVALALLSPLGGCALFGAPDELRGNRAEPELLRELTPGVASKADVTALLGSPSATATFDDREWYYISATTHTRPGRLPGVDNQRVVVIRFNDRGVVESIEQKGEGEMRNVAVVSRTTPVPGNERSLLQALFGNIGRFGPTPTQPTTPGAGAPAP